VVTVTDLSHITGKVSSSKIPYDVLVYAVGSEIQTFGIPGVKENAVFMKELHDAEKVSISPYALTQTEENISSKMRSWTALNRQHSPVSRRRRLIAFFTW
jgi:NADH dehydrogenase FAD-containing subunit